MANKNWQNLILTQKCIVMLFCILIVNFEMVSILNDDRNGIDSIDLHHLTHKFDLIEWNRFR